MNRDIGRHYLIASDFDQTLSFNDSGLVLSSLLGIEGYGERVAGLARTNLVQQGGELAYPVSEITVAGNLGDIYQRLVPGSDLEFRGATNTPSVLADAIAIGGR